jgi:predicted TIM-barrel fold metal-dependent hydrolase
MPDTLQQYGLTREDLVHLVEGPWRRLRAVVEKRVIDFHAHNWSGEVKKIRSAGTVRERKNEGVDYTEELIMSMDVHGIEKACVSWAKNNNWERASYTIWLESLARYPDRLIEAARGAGGANVDKLPADGREAADFIRQRLRRGARMIGSMELPNRANLEPKAVAPIMEVAEEFDVPIFCGTGVTSEARGAMRHPELFLPLIQAYPNVKIVIGDAGGRRFPMGGGWQAIMGASMYENAFVEISGGTVEIVEMAVRTLGAERVIFGSNQSNPEIRYFEPHGQWDACLQWSTLNAVALANLSEAQRDMILHKNTRRLLKMNQ